MVLPQLPEESSTIHYLKVNVMNTKIISTQLCKNVDTSLWLL